MLLKFPTRFWCLGVGNTKLLARFWGIEGARTTKLRAIRRAETRDWYSKARLDILRY
jgi:hypothetical protein